MAWVFLAVGFFIGGEIAWREDIGKLKSLQIELKAKQELEEFKAQANKKIKKD